MSSPTLPDSTTGNFPVEPKVKIAGIAAYFFSLVLTSLFAGFNDGNLISFIPDQLAPFVVSLLPAIGTWIAAYAAKHQFRAGGNGATG